MHTRRRFLSAAAAAPLFGQSPAVIRTGVKDATKDKLQSKLWFAHGVWWAMLPTPFGPAVWKRTAQGWQRQAALDAPLRGLPAQADVLLADGAVHAVLVETDRIAAVSLAWNPATATYAPGAAPVLLTTHKGIETATIAHAAGRLWIAYNSGRHMYVRTAAPGGSWAEPEQITQTAAKDDDICQIIAFPGGVGVLWSDQAADAVYFRRHDGTRWLPPETADHGGNTADDHISAAVAKDGTLYVATKNSVDTEGQPQQVLRIRNPQGEWRNLPYAPLTATEQPTRPIALLSADQRTLHLLHTVAVRRAKPARSRIVHIATPAARPVPSAPAHSLPAHTLIDGPAAINNVTGAKQTAGLVIASDAEGNVYEARF
ncbi:MAG TPA: hypothetical protein VFQ91_10200 [Bryobacteraceae bacterium]|nr:hypothetical protein [Bryobacteraceae bacterium]